MKNNQGDILVLSSDSVIKYDIALFLEPYLQAIKFLTIGLIIVSLALTSCYAEGEIKLEFASQEFSGFTVGNSTEKEDSSKKYISVANISEMLTLYQMMA